MAVRHLFDTSPHSTARSRVILGVFRGFAGPPAHLLGMSSETAYHTDFESILSLSELAVRLGPDGHWDVNFHFTIFLTRESTNRFAVPGGNPSASPGEQPSSADLVGEFNTGRAFWTIAGEF
jgi:hypothetical protein